MGPDSVAVAAQPFWLRIRAEGRIRRHVPDFFLVRADPSGSGWLRARTWPQESELG